jgi:integrase
MGMIYKRGNTWWIKYYRNGKSYRESSKSTKKMVAKKLLDRREGDIAQGKIPGIQFNKISFDQLADDFLRDYRINKNKSLVRAERSVNHLKQFFEGMKVPAISTPKINEYVETRLIEGAANASVNRELAALKRMLNLGAKQTPPMVDRVPHIPMLRENNARKGFFEHDQFLALRDALPEYLKNFVTFAYKTGWRLSEITDLTWARVDRHQGIVRLEAGETKNDEGRTVYLDDELKSIINQQWEARKTNSKMLAYIFLNRKGDDKIKRFDKAWANACKDAKAGKRIFHDLRRTAVRNMVRSGIPENVAMMISGHKTRTVFERYNITNDADLIEAARKQAAYLDSQVGTVSGTIVDIKEKEANQ